MSVQIQANVEVATDLLSRFSFSSYNSIVQARIELAQQIRLSMQFTEAYKIPLDQKLPAGQGLETTAQYVHPWNVACALMNVCMNGSRFGGENLTPQEDLQLYANEWVRLGTCWFPTATLAAAEPAAPPAPSPSPQPPSAEAQAPLPMPEPDGQQAAAQAAPAATTITAAADKAAARRQPEHEGGDLPDSNIRLERRGSQTGRPQKSPFEKAIEERKKVAEPPFWWKHMVVSAPRLFTSSPAGALDDSSSGSGPVQSYMVLLSLVQRVLADVDAYTTVAALRNYLHEIDQQVSQLPDAKAANQLRSSLLPAPRK